MQKIGDAPAPGPRLFRRTYFFPISDSLGKVPGGGPGAHLFFGYFFPISPGRAGADSEPGRQGRTGAGPVAGPSRARAGSAEGWPLSEQAPRAVVLGQRGQGC